MRAGSTRYLTVTARTAALLSVAYAPNSPCTAGAANCTLEVQASVHSLMLPTDAPAGHDPAYSGVVFNNIGTLRIRDSAFDIMKNEVPYVNYTEDDNAPPFNPSTPWTPGKTYLFDETYHDNLAAASVVVNASSSPGNRVLVQRSRFTFSGDPLSESDYFSYYGGQRSFPNAQLAGLLLMTSGEQGHFITVNVSDSNFTGHAASRGGGIYVPFCTNPWFGNGPGYGSPNTNIRIQRCTFSGNQAYIKGGAVFVGRQCNTAIVNSTFTNNQIVYSEPYYHRVMDEFGYRGGAVSAAVLLRYLRRTRKARAVQACLVP